MNLQDLANLVRKDMFSMHRGAFLVGENIVAFGNDGYKEDPRTVKEVEYLREMLPVYSLKEVGFATDKSGYTWVLVIRSKPVPDLSDVSDTVDEIVWDGWFEACGIPRKQKA